MRIALLVIGIVLLAVGASGQVANDPELLGQLKKLFPSAATFSLRDRVAVTVAEVATSSAISTPSG